MATDSKPVIGLSGGIGSGKSTVAAILREMGCVVSDSDRAGRAALRDPAIKEALVRWWGRGILDRAGEVDRRAVAAIVFADPQERRRLESLTHPWIEARRREQFAAAGEEAVALVIDAPLLFEAGLDRACDATIFVETTASTRAERVRSERGWDGAELARREDSQMPLDEKRSRADYVVDNDGDPEHLSEQVRRVLSDIVRSRRDQSEDHPLRSP